VHPVRLRLSIIVSLVSCVLAPPSRAAQLPSTTQQTYALEVLKPDRREMVDSVTHAHLVFLTTSTPSRNFYFHERSWLLDGSMILFYGSRGLMGYLPPTGELVVISTPSGPVRSATAAATRNSLFCLRRTEVLELTPVVEISANPETTPSVVTVREQVISQFPGSAQLNGSCDDRYVSAGINPSIYIMDVQTGQVREVCKIPPEFGRASHVQWSRTDPNLLSFAAGPDRHRAGTVDRIQVVDIREGMPRSPYHQVENELVTHESWWVNGQILFCGAYEPMAPLADVSHLKVLDPRTGIAQIVGAGSWWPGAVPRDLAKVNWWHASGSVDGRWVAGDNWHGDIMLFEGGTTRPHLLTVGHRTYGSGAHPEVGWDHAGRQVVFQSNMLEGGSHVCVATIPDSLQALNPTLPAGRKGR